MEIAAWILGAVLLLWGIGAYNRLIDLIERSIMSAWQNQLADADEARGLEQNHEEQS